MARRTERMASKDPVLYTMPRLQIEGFGRAPAFDGTTDQPPKQQQPLSPGMPNSTVTARAVVGDTNAMVVIEDVTSSPDSNTTTAVATYSSDGQGNTCLGDASGVNSELGRKLAWLALEKQAAESRCRELEKKLAEARDTAAKRETRYAPCWSCFYHLTQHASQDYLSGLNLVVISLIPSWLLFGLYAKAFALRYIRVQIRGHA